MTAVSRIEESPRVTNRIQWLDVARGIGITLVVAGHVERGLVSAGIARGAAWQTFDVALYSFHMPLFMLLAGINIPASYAKGRSVFLSSKLWTVAYPYLIWSLIQGSFLVLLSGVRNGSAGWWDLAKIGWQPIPPFWFLYVLMVYVVIAATVRLRPSILVPLALAALVGSAFIGSGDFKQNLLYEGIFFVAGVCLSDKITSWHAKAGLVPPFALIWLLAFQLLPAGGSRPYLTPASVPAAFAGIAFVLAFSQFVLGPAMKLFAQLGRLSMAIYVMHILAAAGARIALSLSGVRLSAPLYMLVCTLVGVLLPVAAYRILERLGLLSLFGLARPNSNRVLQPNIGEEIPSSNDGGLSDPHNVIGRDRRE